MMRPEGQDVAELLDTELSVAELATREMGALCDKMGIRLIEASAHRVVGTMPVDGNTQPRRFLHGGASVVLAETVGSVGATAHAGPGFVAVGVDVNATHHRSSAAGTVTATAKALHLGSKLASYEVIIVNDDDGSRLCTARITCFLKKIS